MAKWIEVTDSKFGGWHCSKCGYFDWPGKRTRFCPDCGAKMKNPYDGLLESISLFTDIRKIKAGIRIKEENYGTEKEGSGRDFFGL